MLKKQLVEKKSNQERKKQAVSTSTDHLPALLKKIQGCLKTNVPLVSGMNSRLFIIYIFIAYYCFQNVFFSHES